MSIPISDRCIEHEMINPIRKQSNHRPTNWQWDDDRAVRIGWVQPDGSTAWRYGSVCDRYPDIEIYLGAPLSEGAPYHIRIQRRGGSVFDKILDTFLLHCQGQELGIQAKSLEEAKKKAPAAIKKALRYVMKKHKSDCEKLISSLF